MDDFEELTKLKPPYWNTELAITLLVGFVLELHGRVKELERAREQTETYEAEMRERGL